MIGMALSIRDRVFGCVVGGALGDALGGPYEGRRGPIRVVHDLGRSISDDTQLTLATLESVIETGTVSPEHIAARFLAWFQAERITGIGGSTFKALRDLKAGTHWALAGAKGEMAAGNGAAMRVAPLAFLLDPASPDDCRTLRDVCRITHHSDEAYLGGLAVVWAVRLVAFSPGFDVTHLLHEVATRLPDSRVRDRIREIAALSADVSMFDVGARFGCSGYVVDSVPLALRAAELVAQATLLDVVDAAIEPGGDTDTIAAIAGQIAGAYGGASTVPQPMVENLRNAEEIADIARRFAERVADAG